MRAILTWHSIDDSGSPVSFPPGAFTRPVSGLTSGRAGVTSVDSLIGAGYAFVVEYAMGWPIARIYNRLTKGFR